APEGDPAGREVRHQVRQRLRPEVGRDLPVPLAGPGRCGGTQPHRGTETGAALLRRPRHPQTANARAETAHPGDEGDVSPVRGRHAPGLARGGAVGVAEAVWVIGIRKALDADCGFHAPLTWYS